MEILTRPFASVESLVITLLIAFSVVTWVLLLSKSVLFYRLEQRDRAFLKAFWKTSNLSDAAQQSAQYTGPFANLARAGFSAIQIDSGNSGGLEREINFQDRLERALRQQIQRERNILESGLAVVATIGSISPFIGLFGTVWGIMEALKGISAAGNASLETVAGPVGAALLATGVGIAVAVPAVLVYNYFLRRLKLATGKLDDFAHDFYSLTQKSGFRLANAPSILAEED